jgi:hypothetical protein
VPLCLFRAIAPLADDAKICRTIDKVTQAGGEHLPGVARLDEIRTLAWQSEDGSIFEESRFAALWRCRSVSL